MYFYHIYNALVNGAKHTSFHMPGHKANADFKKLFSMAELDITELSYSDSLISPTGVIERAEREIAEILKAKKAFITTDGSTSGVYAMLYIAAKRGSKIIVPRNSHKCVFTACKLFNLEPVIVQGKNREGIMLPPDEEEIATLIVNDRTIAGMIAISPDYYGNLAPLEKYKNITRENGRLLFVDGAHGAHLAFEENMAGYAGVFADMWVDGAHKTLSALTQGAIVCVNEESVLQDACEAMEIFRTTSPSYPIMASVEYGVKYLAGNPEEYLKAKAAVNEFKSELQGFEIYPSDDWAKIALDFKNSGISPDEAVKILENKGIYCEFSDGRYLLLYLSPATDAVDLKTLKRQLTALLSNKKIKGTYLGKPDIPSAERTYSYLYAFKKEAEYVPINDSMGRMAAQNAGIAPPCIPVICAGEIISAHQVRTMNAAKAAFGVVDGKIKVLKK